MKHMSKRLGCAALAAQMLLSPAAQAAEPLRQALDESMRAAVMSHASSCLERQKQVRETFPQLQRLAKSGKLVAQAAVADDSQNEAPSDASSQYADNGNLIADTSEATEIDTLTEETETDTLTEEAKTLDTSSAASTDMDLPDSETTTPDEMTAVDKPEKTSLPSRAPRRRSRGGISTFTLGDPDLGDYLDTWTVLAIFGFGPEYRVPKNEEKVKGAQDEKNEYKYNVEDPGGKSWFDFRYNSTENEQWAKDYRMGGWLLAPAEGEGHGERKDFAYLFGQTYDATAETGEDEYTGDPIVVNINDLGTEFEWRNDDSERPEVLEQHFIGALPGSDKYKNDNGIDLPRLPNKEFTNEWYVLGSDVSKDDDDGSNGITIDGIRGYSTFRKLFTAIDSYSYQNYQALVYDESRDFYLFDPDEPLCTFEWNRDDRNPTSSGYRAMMDPFDPYDPTVPMTLPLIGKWKDSSNATLTALGMTQRLVENGTSTIEDVALYPVNDSQSLSTLKGKTYRELGKADKSFDPETTEYFLRLPATATELSVKENMVISYEPGSAVTLSATYAGLSDPVKYSLEGRDNTEYDRDTAHNPTIPHNSYDNPARGIWTLPKGDPSVPVVIKAGEEEHELESVTFHVVPPSKDEADAQDYVIQIQRLQDPKLVKDPGNTPMGMIERNIGPDDPRKDLRDDTWTEAKKQQAKANFEANTSFKSGPIDKFHPADRLTNNYGMYWMGIYHADAWGVNEANVDLDPAAIVVYPNTTFEVPGFSIINSLGEKEEEATEIVDPTSELPDNDPNVKIPNITWKLELTTVDKLLPDVLINIDTSGHTTSTHTWEGDTEVGKISLGDYNVKPGVYKLSYTYTDIYDGREHSGDSFDRTVVVLPLHGDVDMDGSVTPADGIALRALLDSNNAALSCGNVASSLYYFRVCDINGNGAVNSDDVDRLLSGYSSKECDWNKNTGEEYFYVPLSGDEPRQAIKATVSAAEPNVPSVSLKYLGAGNNVDSLDANSRVNYNPDADSIFWMELQLGSISSVDAFVGDALTSFTATLTYNSDYVEPYKPASWTGTWGDYAISLNSLWDGWELQYVSRYELGPDDTIVKIPIETGIKPVNTPSKALSLLTGFARENASPEVRFSVTPTARVVNRNPLTKASADGAVLKLPFRLKKFPTGQANQNMKLVELALGPRDFLVTTETSGVIKAALWDNNPVYKVGHEPTNNINLKDKLKFVGSDDVKLGSDATPCYYVYVSQPDYATDITSTSAYGKNLVYGHGQDVTMNTYGVKDGKPDVLANRVPFTTDAIMGGNLVWAGEEPGPYNYNVNSHRLTITPTKTGAFDFTIEGNPTPYRLVVDKSPLTLTVNDVKKYYGETTSTDMTFTYDTAQIMSLDAGNGTNSGNGSDLGGVIAGYTAPAITLKTAAENGNDITAATAPGDYTVLIQGGLSDNYIFNYTRADKTVADKEHISDKLGTAKLTVLPRPLLVNKVTKEPVGTLAEKTNSIGVAGTAKTNEFTLADLDEDTDLSGYDVATKTIKGVPIDPAVNVVSGDELELSYIGEVKKNESDPPLPSTEFKLTQDKEERAAEITSISLTVNAGTQNDRYELKNKKEQDVTPPYAERMLPIDTIAKASVEKRKMTKIEIGHLPTRMNYTYGQVLDMDQLRIDAYFSDAPNQAEQASHSLAVLKRDLGIEAYWVDDESTLPDDDAVMAVDGEALHVADRDGKYLCLIDGASKGAYVHLGPFHVAKQALTLTLQTETRYYGESIANWTVGYNFGQLAEWDRATHPQVSGELDDLAVWMAGYTAPDILSREDTHLTAKPVTETTDIGSYFTLISGGGADDYKFEFTKTGASGTEGISADFGYAPLHIEPRPILITSVVGSAGSMYHDTRSYFIDPARAVAGGSSAGFQAVLPAQGVTYYKGDFTSYVWNDRWPLTHSAVHRDDTLTALYRGEFLERDNAQMPFYTLAADEPSRTVDVQVTSLRLAGERSKNYLLLFPSADAATNGWAGNSETDSRTTGTVYLRKIERIELTGPDKVNYEYGDLLDLTGLTAKITYVSENGEPSATETVVYSNISLGGVTTTTFKRLGLTLHMGSEDGAEVKDHQQLSVAEHNGCYLYVTGPQYASGSVINARTPRPLNIQKKKLRLTAGDITRKYGEENGVYEYTFENSDLSSWDRDRVKDLPLSGTADALHTASTSAALAAVNAPYADGSSKNQFVAPQFSTLAAYNSSVQGSPYALNVIGGSMANYEFVMEPGQIMVERRPIRVDEIVKNPVYILSENAFSNNNNRPRFQNVVCTQDEFKTSISASNGVTGDPIVSGDNLSLRIVEGYVDGLSEPVNEAAFQGEYEIRRNALITKIELLAGGDNDNYILTNSTNSTGYLSPTITAEDKAIVHRQEIESLRIAYTPQKMEYTYGEPLNLRGMVLEITYKKDDGTRATAYVDPTVMRDVYINYWDPEKPVPTGAELTADPTILQVHPAANGDHLTIAVDTDGFAHNGMKLMVSARPHADKPFVDSALTEVPIVVKPRELTYTLAAEDKDYDHSRDAVGTITLTNVYGEDEVWVKNGTDYTNCVPSDYAFTSGDYHAAAGYDGVKFTFVDENVSYRLSDGHDMFLDLLDIPVEVSEITLDGWDKDNYHINTEVRTTTAQMPGRDGVPSAMILPIERPAPAMETTLWVDEHTNTVKVLASQAPEDFGDSLDSKNTLHYEYALVYENELGGIVITDYQDDPYFGGEPVTVESVENISDRGQILDPEDVLFGTRTPLPRGTWLGALVRIAQTNNYQTSAGQSSFDMRLTVNENDNKDAQLLASLALAAEAAAAQPLPKPEKETDRQEERLRGPVIKTYTYRLDLISTTQEKDGEEKDIFIPTLEAVWFTDISEFERSEDLGRLVGNEPVRYHDYYWDPQKSMRINFPIVMSEDIFVELPVGDSSANQREETLVNPNGTAKIYVSLSTSGGGGGLAGNPRSLKIIPDALTLDGPGTTVQLRVRVSPANLAERGVVWVSSDESVITVSSNGLVTAVGPGTATVTATARKGGVSDAITVVVLDKAKPTTNVPYADTMFNAAFTGAFFDLPTSGLFEPERTMTRRELAVVMNRFFQEVKDRVPGEVSHYVDIGDDPRNSAIENLDRWGIVTGIEENVFAPDRIVTRAEMSVMLCRMLMIPVNNDPNAPHAFSDAVPGIHWAWAYIDALAKAGITKGTGDDKYSPERQVTRAEVATFLCRALITTVDRTKGPIIVPVDVPEIHWAYSFILRAVNSSPAVRLIDAYLPAVQEAAEKK